jgi:hypothetical protein
MWTKSGVFVVLSLLAPRRIALALSEPRQKLPFLPRTNLSATSLATKILAGFTQASERAQTVLAELYIRSISGEQLLPLE